MTAGLVVAGGYSTRFGLAEKPLVEVGGEPMLCRIVRALDGVVDHVAIDCRDDQVAPFETALASFGVDVDPSFVIDTTPDRGPVAGLATGLGAIDAGESVVVSCDRPGVPPELFEHLCRCRRQRSVDAVVPRRHGYLQPLCSAYRTDRLSSAVDAALRAGDRRLVDVLSALDAHVVTERSVAGIVAPAAIESIDSTLDVDRHPVEYERQPARNARSHSAAAPAARVVE